MAAQRPILHLPLIAGASAVAYGLALAFVTAQQASADAAVAAARAPMETAIRDAATQRARTADDVRHAGRILERAAAAYGDALRASAALDEALVALAEGVESASGAAARLPDRLSLPAPRIQVVQVAAPPPVQATTGASGH